MYVLKLTCQVSKPTCQPEGVYNGRVRCYNHITSKSEGGACVKYTCIVSPDTDEEEIIIRVREKTDRVKLLESVIENVLESDSSVTLYVMDTEYYVPKRDILYFETESGGVKAHTADRIYTAEYRLFELEQIMPPYFTRVSKSCILNVMKVEAIRRNPIGASEVFLRGCDKKVYVSRAYYKILKEKIDEVRL